MGLVGFISFKFLFFFEIKLIDLKILNLARYPGHDGYSDPYGASTPSHPYDHSPFQTVPNVGGPSDPWVPPTDIGHHNGMSGQVTTQQFNLCKISPANKFGPSAASASGLHEQPQSRDAAHATRPRPQWPYLTAQPQSHHGITGIQASHPGLHVGRLSR